ncbi:hypothetical protein LX73_1119 [Fodinibius salinus]|uniref:Uncharacterized protein n=1 Tax=Fodinibius salinus TaxID=860790 RepID=A0A5D3YIM5_9BACT|nr:hypothetical protein [Fodinibius salinus]TYP93415.1 hypothetical protein LX73_1119 [Fodinibius salinus]
MDKNIISKTALGGAVAAPPIILLAFIADAPNFELYLNIFSGAFLIFIFLHWFFRDDEFDKLEAIKRSINILYFYYAIIVFVAKVEQLYILMFMTLGLFGLTYFISNLVSILELEKEDES